MNWTEALPRDKVILANAYHRTGVMRWAEAQVVRRVEDANIPTAKSGVSIVNFYSQQCGRHMNVAEFSEATALAIARPMNLDALEAATVGLLALRG